MIMLSLCIGVHPVDPGDFILNIHLGKAKFDSVIAIYLHYNQRFLATVSVLH